MSGVFFGRLLSDFIGKQDPTSMVTVVQQILEQNGGVQGLIQRFSEAGFGEHVQSWLNGDPLPITGNQLQDVFSSEQINGWATQFGIDPDRLRAALAEALPHAVNFLTPNGQVPASGEGFDFASLLQRFLGR